MSLFPFQEEIEAASNKYGLDPCLVAGFVCTESSFKPEASRFEAKFKQKYVDRHPKFDRLDPKIRTLLAMSMGLMQTMGIVAHEDGLPFTCLEDLYKPEVGLDYGCKQLSQLFKRYNVQCPLDPDLAIPNALTDAISAYNSGTAKRGSRGMYANLGYVRQVLARFKTYRAQGSPGEST